MQVLIDSITCIVLFLIIVQDFRHRLVSVWLLLVLSLLQVTALILHLPVAREIAYTIAINGSFLIMNLVAISIYFSIKHKKWITVTDVYIGKADIILLLILTASFSPLWYLFFFTGSVAATLLYAILSRLFVKSSKSEIPMAATTSICFILVSILKYCIPGFSLYNDSWILGRITFIL